MVSPLVISHITTAVITAAIVAGAIIGGYYIGHNNASTKNVENVVYNNLTVNNGPVYTNGNGSTPIVPEQQCPVLGTDQGCTTGCEFVVCESIPAGLDFGPNAVKSTPTVDCWMRIMNEAQTDVQIGSFYWSLIAKDAGYNGTSNTTASGQKIYDTILATAKKGIKFTIAENYEKGGQSETINLAKASGGNIKVRSLKFTDWYPAGILHTKTWVSDGKHAYIGSANHDWRSLEHVKEVGIAVYNCPCVAGDISRLLDIYWQMGAPGAKLPPRWDNSLSANNDHQAPLSVPQTDGVHKSTYISASPPGFKACNRMDDLDAMIAEIDAAEEYLHMTVMDFAPATLYLKPNVYFDRLDTAIRRAAFDRQVKVKLLISRWPHTFASTYSYLHSLNDLNDQLPCRYPEKDYSCKNGTRGEIQVKMVEVPLMEDKYGFVEFGRVFHNKYFVTEKAVYVGTSNWSADYWWYTAGIGIVVKSDDGMSSNPTTAQLQAIFLRDWNSQYTTPISDYDTSGHKKNATTF